MSELQPAPLAINVREASIADAAIIADYNARMAAEIEHRVLDPAIALRGAKLGLQRPELARYWMAEVDGRVVGQAMVTYEWSDWRAGCFWWFQSVYVLPEFRRRGVFKALYAHVETTARQSPEVCGLRLYVETRNHHAQATYQQLGMVPSGHLVFEVDWSGAVTHESAAPAPG